MTYRPSVRQRRFSRVPFTGTSNFCATARMTGHIGPVSSRPRLCCACERQLPLPCTSAAAAALDVPGLTARPFGAPPVATHILWTATDTIVNNLQRRPQLSVKTALRSATGTARSNSTRSLSICSRCWRMAFASPSGSLRSINLMRSPCAACEQLLTSGRS